MVEPKMSWIPAVGIGKLQNPVLVVDDHRFSKQCKAYANGEQLYSCIHSRKRSKGAEGGYVRVCTARVTLSADKKKISPMVDKSFEWSDSSQFMTVKGEQRNIVQHDEGPKERPAGLEGAELLVTIKKQQRVVVFSEADLMEDLRLSKEICVDGTFASAPKFYCQVLVVLVGRVAEDGSRFYVPAAWILLSSKKRKEYKEAFTAIQKMCPGFSPASVMTDFERSLYTAWAEVWPNTIHKRCFFHHRQSIWRRVGRLGMRRWMARDPFVRKLYSQLCALSFMPLNEVEECWVKWMEQTDATGTRLVPRRMDRLCSYYGRYYTGIVFDAYPSTSYERVKPQFPPQDWNMHDLVMRGGMTTSNSAESQNSVLKAMVGLHPSVYTFARSLHNVIGTQREKLATSHPSLPELSTLGTASHTAMGAALEAAKEDYARATGEVPDDTEDEDGEAAEHQAYRDLGLEPSADDASEAEDAPDAAPDAAPEASNDDAAPEASDDDASFSDDADDEDLYEERAAKRVRYLNRVLRTARSYRRQRQVRPALIRDLLQRYPAEYTRRKPSPILALLKDVAVALDGKIRK